MRKLTSRARVFSPSTVRHPGSDATAGRPALAAAAFTRLERRSDSPVLNRALLRSGGVRAGLTAGAAVNFALNGSLFVLPLLLAGARHLSAAATGLAFLPMTIPFALNPPVTGRIVARVGPRPPIITGLALLTAGGTELGGAIGAGAGYGWLAAGLLLTGFGVSLVLPALVTAILAAAPEGTAGSVGGLLNAVRQAGATLGVAAMGTLAGAGTVAGSACALALSGVVCAAAVIGFAAAGRPALLPSLVVPRPPAVPLTWGSRRVRRGRPGSGWSSRPAGRRRRGPRFRPRWCGRPRAAACRLAAAGSGPAT